MNGANNVRNIIARVTLTGSDTVTLNQSSASTSVDTGGIGNAGNLTVTGGTLKISGKGGLPPSPEETLSDDPLMVNWATLPQPNREESTALTPNSQLNLQNSPLIEAQ